MVELGRVVAVGEVDSGPGGTAAWIRASIAISPWATRPRAASSSEVNQGSSRVTPPATWPSTRRISTKGRPIHAGSGSNSGSATGTPAAAAARWAAACADRS